MHYEVSLLVAVAMGFIARAFMLRIDYRQYPSYPQGYVIHLSIAATAALLGAILVPALLEKEFTAATFLALAASQFREVRTMERETLMKVEETELVSRGNAYIEGIARVFEARNYVAGWTALATSFGFYLGQRLLGQSPMDFVASLIIGIAGGLVTAILINRAMVGLQVRDIADVVPVEVTFDGSLLTVDGISIMNVGLKEARQTYLDNGMAVVIKPKDANAKATLAHVGQRQAIAHDAATLMGVQKDVDTPEFTPLVRRDPKTGKVVMAIVAAEKNTEALMIAVGMVPVLEGVRRKPLQSVAGKMVK